MKLYLLTLSIFCWETIYYHSILKFDINPDITSYQDGPCKISLNLKKSKSLDENKILRLIRYIEKKYSEFKDLYSHLSRYYSELNKENADIGLPQKHISGVYSAEFDSSKLELIYQLKNEVEQPNYLNKIKLRIYIKEYLEINEKQAFLHHYLSQFNCRTLDSTILKIFHSAMSNKKNLIRRRGNYKKSRYQPTINLYNKIEEKYAEINNIKDEIGFNSDLLVDMNSLLDYYLKIKNKYTNNFKITYICLHKIIYNNIHKFESNFNHLLNILNNSIRNYNVVRRKYEKHYGLETSKGRFSYNLNYNYKPNIIIKDSHELKIKFEDIFNDLKSRYPIHFEYPITADNSGYISKYADSSDESENIVYSGNSDYDDVYQSLQQEYNSTFAPQTEFWTSYLS